MRAAFQLTVVAFAACAGCSSPSGEAVDAAVDAPVDARLIDAWVIDAPPSSNPGFPVPTAITKANDFATGAWTEVGNADWSCLGTPSPDQPSIQNLALSGKVFDFQNGNGAGAATITGFAGIMVNGNLGTATSDSAAGTRGNYSMPLMRLPVGQTRYGFKIEAGQYMRTYVLNQ